MQKSFVPALLGAPKLENHEAPRRRIVGATAIDFDVVHRRRRAVEAHAGRERRLHPGHALLAFEQFQHRRLFAADVGAGSVMDVQVERPAVDVVLAYEVGLIGLIHGLLEPFALKNVFAAQIDISRLGAHGERGHERAFDQRVRIVAQDFAVLAGAGLGFVGVDDQIVWTLRVDILGHEGPLQAGRETRPSAPPKAGGLHLGNDPVAALVENAPSCRPTAREPARLSRPRSPRP